MAIKRIVSTDFWTDEKVINDFTPEDKYFFLYLLTNPHSSLLGVYRLVPKQAAFEMGYSVDAVNALLERFERKYGRIKYNRDTCEVAIRNYLKHGIVTGGKPVRDRLEQDAQAVKDKSLLAFIANANEDNENDTVQQFLSALPPEPPTYGYGNGNGNGNGESYHDSSTTRTTSRTTTRTTTRFTPPSLTEVQSYCTERANKVDPQRFVDFYESKGWFVGKNRMKDWRAAVRNWESRDKPEQKPADYSNFGEWGPVINA